VDPRAFHESLVVVDGHCDTIGDIVGDSFSDPSAPPRDFFARSRAGHIDLPRLAEGGITCQAMALFTDDKFMPDAVGRTHTLLDALESMLASSDAMRLARNAGDILRAKAEGRVAALFAIEGGEAIGEHETGLDLLRSYHARGLRMMGLTWNRRNAIARGVGAEGSGGVTEFGRAVVAEMERLGIVVDASHLSDEALEDLLAIAERPIVATHSNSRELCPHRRNLLDSQVERIAATGGLVGVTFAGIFVDPDPAKVTVARVADHVDRLVSVAGAAHVGLGSDFDGFTARYGQAFASCAELPLLTAELLDRGHPPEDVAKIMGGNWLRVIGEIAG
jgi:membrane dipeptidase